MAQFIDKEPITYSFLPWDTLTCSLCSHTARSAVTVRDGATQVKLPLCRWHAIQAETEPEIVFREP